MFHKRPTLIFEMEKFLSKQENEDRHEILSAVKVFEEYEFQEIVQPVIEAYIDKFGCDLPANFDVRLDDPNDNDEWATTIQKAIDNNKPFDAEHILDE
jgi:hypothetical protein